MVSSFDLLELKTNPYANFEVRDGDKIIIPKRSNSVSVVGEVLNATSIKFYPDYDVNDYLNSAGGLNFQADKDRIYVIAPNGESKIYKRKFLRKGTDIMPGSTVVVSRDARPWDAVKLTQIITPILADLATSAAAIAAISD
jgi:protein involved in polysaccharide export with SLBB domain